MHLIVWKPILQHSIAASKKSPYCKHYSLLLKALLSVNILFIFPGGKTAKVSFPMWFSYEPTELFTKNKQTNLREFIN